jgi:hypothetical protein
MKFNNPETQAIYDALVQNTHELVTIPNSMLPEAYHNKRDGGRTLENLNSLHAKKTEESPHVIEKREKAERIEEYRKQNDSLGVVNYQTESPDFSIDYKVDEDRLYAKQIRFAQLINLDLEDDDAL